MTSQHSKESAHSSVLLPCLGLIISSQWHTRNFPLLFSPSLLFSLLTWISKVSLLTMVAGRVLMPLSMVGVMLLAQWVSLAFHFFTFSFPLWISFHSNIFYNSNSANTSSYLYLSLFSFCDIITYTMSTIFTFYFSLSMSTTSMDVHAYFLFWYQMIKRMKWKEIK